MSTKASSPYVRPVELPTRGLLYPDLCPNGTVMVDPMTSTDEAKIAGATQHNVDLIVEKIIADRVVDGWNAPDLSPMITIDRLAVLFNVRTTTYGGNYSFDVECPRCSQEASYTIDLDKLPVHYFDEEDYELEPFTLKLPMNGKEITWRFLRGSDEAAERLFKKRRAKDGGKDDISQTYQLARRLLTVENQEVTHFGHALKFVKSLHARDSRVWVKATEDIVFGIGDQLEITCRLCGKDYVISLPMSTDFFRPEFDARPESSDIFAGDVLISFGRNDDTLPTDNGPASSGEDTVDAEHREGKSREGSGGPEAIGGDSSDGEDEKVVASPALTAPAPETKAHFDDSQEG